MLISIGDGVFTLPHKERLKHDKENAQTWQTLPSLSSLSFNQVFTSSFAIFTDIGVTIKCSSKMITIVRIYFKISWTKSEKQWKQIEIQNNWNDTIAFYYRIQVWSQCEPPYI